METNTEFDEIFRLYYSQLFSYALQMINDQEECHDIVSSAYEYIWANFKKIKKESAKTYLYTIVKTKCINYLRHQNRRRVSCISYYYPMSYILPYILGLHCGLQYIIAVHNLVPLAHCKSSK